MTELLQRGKTPKIAAYFCICAKIMNKTEGDGYPISVL